LTAEPYPQQRRDNVDVRSALREILETVLLTVVIFIVVRLLVQNFQVEGTSMDPSLRNGQYVLVNKATYFSVEAKSLARFAPWISPNDPRVFFLFQGPERGDVIVFRFPREPSREFIKRVMALPGETVEVRGGKVIVNGQQLSEPYIERQASYNFGPEMVPADNYFVLGDNRNNSSDSHIWGMVPRDKIIGKSWVYYRVTWPTEWGWPMNLGRWVEFGLAPNYRIGAT
jgi:signal peptidase I